MVYRELTEGILFLRILQQSAADMAAVLMHISQPLVDLEAVQCVGAGIRLLVLSVRVMLAVLVTVRIMVLVAVVVLVNLVTQTWLALVAMASALILAER